MVGRSKQVKNSLQYQLSLWISVFITATSIVTAVLSFALGFQDAHEQQDYQLQQVAALVSVNALSFEPLPDEHAHDRDPEDSIVIQQLATSIDSGVKDELLISLPNDLPEGIQTITSNSQDWRIYVRTLPAGIRVAVGQQTNVRNERALDSGLRSLIPLLIVILPLIFLVSLVIRNTLKPVARLSRQVDEQRDENLVALVSEEVPSEIQPFVASINRLLTRLSAAMEQQRRFVADAAHELRSPIAALMLQAENLEHTLMSEDTRQRWLPLKQGLSRTRLLLEQLLTLVRSQAAPLTQGERVLLDRIVRDVMADILLSANAKNIDLGGARIETVEIVASSSDLISVIRNALDNAVRYTPPGGTVNVSVYAEQGRAYVVVEDTGPGIPEQELEHVFDPFYRVMGSGESGSGLGLSIVRGIAERWRARVLVRNIVDGGRTGIHFEYSQLLQASTEG